MNNQIQQQQNIIAMWQAMFAENNIDPKKLTKLTKNQRKRLCQKINKELKKTKGKKRKAKGKSAYIFFCIEARETHSEEFKEIGNQRQIMKRLGELWREAKESGNVDKYVKLAEEDRQRVSDETDDESEADSPREEEQEEAQVPVEAPKKPKRASSTYIYFCRLWRPALFNISPRGKTKALGLLWKTFKKACESGDKWEPDACVVENSEMIEEWQESMTEKKEELVELTNKDKERYSSEMEAWNAANGNVIPQRSDSDDESSE